jgi:MinD-like ATPase involved in chromosome partitioning or flagellar assembly
MSSGTVVTFYSYKGGVGRSFITANVGAILCMWGYRVLLIDWDLEAPGLTEYFRDYLPSTPMLGLTELISAFARRKPSRWQRHVTGLKLPSGSGLLKIMPAGKESPSYARKVQQLDWPGLYMTADLGGYLETLRQAWIEEFDFVLIDSRTGITDISGICTVQLPDILALVVTANNQSLAGGLDVVARAIEQRTKLSYDRQSLHVMPIVSRLDMREEYELATQWLEKLESALRPLYATWVSPQVAPASIIQYTRVPYHSYWSYGERLAAVEERGRDPESISYYLHNVAALLAANLAEAGMLSENRDSFVNAARHGTLRFSQDRGRFEYDVFLSYGPGDASYAMQVAEALKIRKIHALYEPHADDARNHPQRRIDASLRLARHLVLLWGEESSRWQAETARQFLTTSLLESEDRRLLPVSLSSQRSAVMPWYLQQTRSIDASSRTPEDVADLIARLIGSGRSQGLV